MSIFSSVVFTPLDPDPYKHFLGSWIRIPHKNLFGSKYCFKVVPVLSNSSMRTRVRSSRMTRTRRTTTMTRRSRTSTTRMKWRRRSRTRTRSRTTRIMTTPAMSSSRRTKTRTRKTRTRSCRRTRTRSNLKMGCHRYHRTDERLTFSLHSRTCLQLGGLQST